MKVAGRKTDHLVKTFELKQERQQRECLMGLIDRQTYDLFHFHFFGLFCFTFWPFLFYFWGFFVLFFGLFCFIFWSFFFYFLAFFVLFFGLFRFIFWRFFCYFLAIFLLFLAFFVERIRLFRRFLNLKLHVYTAFLHDFKMRNKISVNKYVIC